MKHLALALLAFLLCLPVLARTSGGSGTTISGSGTNNTLLKFTAEREAGNSIVSDDGSRATIAGKISSVASATGGTAPGYADDIVVDNNTTSGITILSGTNDSGYLIFGKSGVSENGSVTYNHLTNSMLFVTNTTLAMTIDSGQSLNLSKINDPAASNLSLFGSASSGETPELKISGFRAADALRTLEIGVGVDADDTASFDGLSTYFFDGTVSVQDGAEATPSIVNDGDANTGMWFPAADTVAMSTGGSEQMRIDSSGVFHATVGKVDIGGEYVAHFTDIYSGGTGRVFTLQTGFNGAQAWLSFDAYNHNGYVRKVYHCINNSGNWIVVERISETNGTAPTVSVAGSGGANPTITITGAGANPSFYSGGVCSYRCSTNITTP